jgi:hypothetical protein
MSSRTVITSQNGDKWFCLERLSQDTTLVDFSCAIPEYNAYLFEDAMRSQKDHIALTWLLRERSSGTIAAYMSLIADAIKLSLSEKELHNLDYPFMTLPAMKIAKLAVDKTFSQQYRGIGSFMIQTAMQLMYGLNQDYIAARFLTVDADIEHDKGILTFYEKNGFILNTELYNKNRKTVSMRRDIYQI